MRGRRDETMKAASKSTFLAVVALLMATACEGCTFSRTELPDGFRVEETGVYWLSPIPYAEGGIHYTFIGLGWLAHDERRDDMHLYQGSTRLAVMPGAGSTGWEFTPAGKKLLKNAGWAAAPLRHPDDRSNYVVGGTAWSNLQGVPSSAERMTTKPNPYYFYDPAWVLILRPIEIISRPCNSAVFLCDVHERLYVRLAGFNSAKHAFIDAKVVSTYPDVIIYRLKELDTGKIVEHRFAYDADTLAASGIGDEPQRSGLPGTLPTTSSVK